MTCNHTADVTCAYCDHARQPEMQRESDIASLMAEVLALRDRVAKLELERDKAINEIGYWSSRCGDLAVKLEAADRGAVLRINNANSVENR